jgi:serine O-acetyltransferase
MFEAYGVTPNGDDPLSSAIHGLVNHAAAQEQQITTIIAILRNAGLRCETLPEMDKFDPEQLNKLVE